jgi:hypothetical protein
VVLVPSTAGTKCGGILCLLLLLLPLLLLHVPVADITPYGLPYGAWGFLYVLIFARWLLPDDTGSRPREDLLLAASIDLSCVQVSLSPTA